MHRACLALGSNVGDRVAILDAAVDSLNQAPGIRVLRVSSYYETPAIGGPGGQGAFINAATVVETALEPRELLVVLQTIETQAGRVREVRWGERTLDLDLLLYDEIVLDEPGMTIPHPRMHVREFVLGPLAEIAPEVVDPLTRQTVAGLLANLDRKPNFLCMIGLHSEVIGRVAQELKAFGRFDGSGPSSFEAMTDLLRTPNYERITRRKVAEYDVHNWSIEFWGDRWMISDFWPDLIARKALHDLEGDERSDWRRRFNKRRDSFVRPTFIAASPYSYWQMRLWADLNQGERPGGGGEIPLLCPGYADPMGFIQEHAGTLRLLEKPEPEVLNQITHELLAACAAVRPESLGVPVAPPRVWL